MILHRAIFYKLSEMAIDAFFDSIFNNFRTVDIKDGVRLTIDSIKEGDRFSKVMAIGRWNITYYDVTILDITDENRLIFRYLYDTISSNGDCIYYEGELSEDLTHKYIEYTTLDEEDEIYSDFYSIKKSLFDKIYNEIKAFMIYSNESLSFKDYELIGYK